MSSREEAVALDQHLLAVRGWERVRTAILSSSCGKPAQTASSHEAPARVPSLAQSREATGQKKSKHAVKQLS